jgi:hypothetical protein
MLNIGNVHQDSGDCIEYPKEGKQDDNYVFKTSDTLYSIIYVQNYNIIVLDLLNFAAKEER